MVQMKYLTFGEIMLRLKSPGHECLFQNGTLEATFGGGEANVAVSLANFGVDAAFLTVLPDNPVGSACMGELRRYQSYSHPAGAYGYLFFGIGCQSTTFQGGV